MSGLTAQTYVKTIALKSSTQILKTGRIYTGDAELSATERKEQHDKKIKKLMADLHRDCSVEEVAPEEIEMVGKVCSDWVSQVAILISPKISSVSRSKC